MPSTGSVYATPLKKCFIAPNDMLVIQCDFSSLEDVVLANITLDEGKLAVQRDSTLDAHCYNAMGYYTKQIEEVIGSDGSFVEKVRRFKQGVENKDPILKSLRQSSKPITFKLAYLGYPDAHKGGLITQEVFDNYHNVLYPDVKAYLENYVKPITREKGYLHLGLGCRLYSDDVDADFRTLFNATFQFWSILTLIAVNELNYRIKKAGFQDKIILCSTIYDSIYAYISPDPEVIKWYNDNVVQIGKQDFIPDQQVPNSLECGIGRNWAEEVPIPPNASVKEIEEILEKFKEI
jgi:DNA polymerase I-like protein with 3'-5' exonuclease and polymerase domains